MVVPNVQLAVFENCVPGEFGGRVTVTKDNTTLYASDRDMFVFLADEENRIELPNRDGRLKPGLFAQVRFATGRAEPTLLIPSEAVIRTGARTVVLLAADGGHPFAGRPGDAVQRRGARVRAYGHDT